MRWVRVRQAHGPRLALQERKDSDAKADIRRQLRCPIALQSAPASAGAVQRQPRATRHRPYPGLVSLPSSQRFATDANALVNRETAAAQLGHASVATTRRYAHDDVGKAAKASAALAGRPSLALLDDAIKRQSALAMAMGTEWLHARLVSPKRVASCLGR